MERIESVEGRQHFTLDQEQIGLVATSTEPFGAWATKLWPIWTSAMRTLALGS